MDDGIGGRAILFGRDRQTQGPDSSVNSIELSLDASLKRREMGSYSQRYFFPASSAAQ